MLGIGLSDQDLVLDVDCSSRRLRPASSVVPCLTASRTQGLCLLSRGRRMTASETLRCQGVDDAKCKWRVSDTEKYRLAGNAMSLPVVRAVLQSLLRDIRGCVDQGKDDSTRALDDAAQRPKDDVALSRALQATRRGVRTRCPIMQSRASRAGKFFLDIFGTGGGIASQVENQGFRALRWGDRFGPRSDVRQAGPRREFVRLIRGGHTFG